MSVSGFTPNSKLTITITMSAPPPSLMPPPPNDIPPPPVRSSTFSLSRMSSSFIFGLPTFIPLRA